jgi:hypothetical protein
MGWVLMAVGLVSVVFLPPRVQDAIGRRAVQGAAVLVAAAGLILVLRRTGGALSWPGYRPRPWSNP